jgi:uncharacterized protein YybS (DUF2232 family)
VVTEGKERPEIGSIVRSILLASLILVLPGIQWSLFGWLHIFLPLLAFYLLWVHGGYTGSRLLLSAVGLGALVYLLTGNFDLFVFTSALLFSGYVLYRSAERGDKPHISGLKGSLALACGWALVLAILSIGAEMSAYGQLVSTLDEGIGEALEYYRQSETISAETLMVLEATLYRMKVIIPIIMPGILGSLVMLLVWFTMVTCNLVLSRVGQTSPWVGYRYWQLPEKLIWVVIGTGLSALAPLQPFRDIGINCLILLSIIYCFQGLSIVVFFMNKWNVPILLRSFFYVMIVFQSFGTILLLILGVADIWFDFRKIKPGAANPNNE